MNRFSTSQPYLRLVFAALAMLVGCSARGEGQKSELVAAAVVTPDAHDAFGETMGGFFSGMCWDATGKKLYGVSDRGPLDGAVDYRPRIHRFRLDMDLKQPSFPDGGRNATLTCEATELLKDDARNYFSGADANDSFEDAPFVATATISAKTRALDPEATARSADGTFFIADEYGPYIYQFDANFKLLRVIHPPAHVLPQRNKNGRLAPSFSSLTNPDSGRQANKGFEGLGLSPDGSTLFAMLQAPLVQDVADSNSKAARFTRLLTWQRGRDDAWQLSGEYIYALELLDNGKRATQQNEILLLDNATLLVLERDNRGLGEGNGKQFCRVYLARLGGATNLNAIPEKPYSRLADDPKGLRLDKDALPPSLTPLSKTLFVDLLDPSQLQKAGLTDARQIPAKWEGMALITHESLPSNQRLLLVGVDNDFKTTDAFIRTTAQPEGVHVKVVAKPDAQVPSLLFIYRVSWPSSQPHSN